MSTPVVISSVSSCDLASQVSTVAKSIELRYRPTFDLGEYHVFPRFFCWS